MDEHQTGMSNGRVVAIAGAASGVVATALAALDRGDRRAPTIAVQGPPPGPTGEPTRRLLISGEHQLRSAGAASRRTARNAQRVARATAEDAARSANKARQAVLPKLDEARARTLEAVASQATSAKRKGEEMVTKKGADAVSTVSAVVSQGGQEAARLAHDARQRGTKAKQEVASRAGEVAQRGKDAASKGRDAAQRAVGSPASSAQSTAQSIVTMAAERAVAAAERAKDAGVAVGETAKVRAPQLGHKIEDEVVPSVREIALNAAVAALDLWDAAQERAAKAAGAAQHDLVPQAAHALAVGGERAKATSKHAADVTVDAGKDTGAAFFWAAAAGGLVYYVLLSQERREQMLRVAQTVTGQARELLNDFRGYDAEFT
ncbi:MAG: hypothetical protein AVDCRST_MAG73-2204 [uncultured Thermomicrobiales bacterium]|uniref:Uncharacterized protein n=1 Tax=uncultured Thermomicrobiales bacterium TaxID=1645740 RepID=A0A6J4U8I8_9BACT|nr:MAG: hypothetical protein AVDCRST_MAG73-2204 [uncultured Thermomicrobiales bacterium]